MHALEQGAIGISILHGAPLSGGNIEDIAGCEVYSTSSWILIPTHKTAGYPIAPPTSPINDGTDFLNKKM